MYLTLIVLYTFATVFVLVQCHVQDDVITPIHKFLSSCNDLTYKRGLIRPPKEFENPQPIGKFVKLIADPGYVYHPSMVVVKRCDGSCDNKMTMQVKSEKRTFIVSRHAEENVNKKDCVYVQVEEHESCACKCSVTRDNCPPNQMFNSSKCACECIDQTKIEDCKRKNKMWNGTKCTCDCKSLVKCMTNTQRWDPENCCCVKINK